MVQRLTTLATAEHSGHSMYLKTFRVANFRRLHDVRVDLDDDTTIFVGANNSGKTSATHVFRAFLGKTRGAFQIYDFSARCWPIFDDFDPESGDPETDLPRITLDLWFAVDEANLHRVVELLPDLDWNDEPVGLRVQFAPRDSEQLKLRYVEARATRGQSEQEDSSWRPWPQNFTEYLTRRLKSEYDIRYFVLDHRRCDAELRPEAGYEPAPLRTGETGNARFLDGLLRVDFLDAQRHLSDAESHGRDELLSKRLARFYQRNLRQHEQDVAALGAIADAEARLNDHFAEAFEETLGRLLQLGYPGLSDPALVVKASLDGTSVLNGTARVFYDVPAGTADAKVTLPDQYNGLGFKNLIYMVVEVLDFHFARSTEEDFQPPVHLVMIEEPETHLHAQLQQVFIRKLREVLPDLDEGFVTQLVITTHSAHILYERTFQHIRYFRRGIDTGDNRESDVRDLSRFYENEEPATRAFLLQYLKLTHCDLFFADGSVLVEGNVERLVLPLIIERDVERLRSSHLTILELGGAYAHRFRQLVEFLALPTLVVTDLDSVFRGPEAKRASACMTTQAGARTSNPTLKDWLPGRADVGELLSLSADDKCSDAANCHVRIAYQTLVDATWKEETKALAGRTIEEAFALENLSWTQQAEQEGLGLRIDGAEALDLDALHAALFERVRDVDKTAFALGLIASQRDAWASPHYIVQGLEWLADLLSVEIQAAEEPGLALPVPAA